MAFFISVLLAFAGFAYQMAHANSPPPEIPPDFNLLFEDIGVQFLRKDYPQGTPDFVQIMDMRMGAKIELLHGQISAHRDGSGQYGGADARFEYQSLTQFWRQALAQDEKIFCVINGQFFYMPESPTRLALPLKVNGEIITDGFGYSQYAPHDLLMLEIWDDHVRIRQASAIALNTSSAPNIIGGLSEAANKRAKYAVGRTFIGVDDQDKDRQSETILVFNTSSATQTGAAEILRSFGADAVMMLDGGGSTQLYCRDGWHIQTSRLIPQAIALLAGSGPPYQSVPGLIPYWPVVVAGREEILRIEFTNEGSETWQSDSEELRIGKEPWGSNEQIALPNPAEPGQTAAFEWSSSKLRRSGIYQINASMTHNGKSFPGEAASFNVIVLPEELAERKSELQNLIDEWNAQPDSDTVQMIRTWLEEEGQVKLPVQSGQLAVTGLDFNLNDAILIPLIMLPFILVLAFVIGRIQRRA